MLGRNLERSHAPDGFFHMYNRGINRRVIFKDSLDYEYFEQLFVRHLGTNPYKDAKGREYIWFRPFYLPFYLLAFWDSLGTEIIVSHYLQALRLTGFWQQQV